MTKYLRDPVSGLTHLAGAILGAVGMVFLLFKGLKIHSPWYITSSIIYGISLVLLYSSSALYHLLKVSERHQVTLRRLDHTMIFVLIAGSYTPFCLVSLRGRVGWSTFVAVWLLAVGGIFVKLFWLNAPKGLSTGLYLFMGWIALFIMYPLSQAVSPTALAWLIGGGLFYTVGAIIYAMERPDPFPPHFGFHEIWHLFVLAGSASHFVSVMTLV
jgi:hemolysin III